MPKPMQAKMRKTIANDSAKAKPSAVPKKGAVQGVAKTVAKTPLKKDEDKLSPSPAAEKLPLVPGNTTVKTPNKLKPSAKTNAAIKATNPGY